MANKIFTSGMVPKYPFPNAPKWIKLNLSFKVDEFIEWLQKHKTADSEWLNVDICEGQTAGKLYGSLNTYKKGERSGESEVKQEDASREKLNNDTDEPPADEINPEEIPF